MKCHLKAKSGDPWLAESCIEDLDVKCHLKATSGKRKFVLIVKCDLKAKSGNPRSYRNGSNITLWTTYSTKPSSTVTTAYNTAPNDIIQERLKHNSLDHLQHQASQYRNNLIQWFTDLF